MLSTILKCYFIWYHNSITHYETCKLGSFTFMFYVRIYDDECIVFIIMTLLGVYVWYSQLCMLYTTAHSHVFINLLNKTFLPFVSLQVPLLLLLKSWCVLQQQEDKYKQSSRGENAQNNKSSLSKQNCTSCCLSKWTD